MTLGLKGKWYFSYEEYLCNYHIAPVYNMILRKSGRTGQQLLYVVRDHLFFLSILKCYTE